MLFRVGEKKLSRPCVLITLVSPLDEEEVDKTKETIQSFRVAFLNGISRWRRVGLGEEERERERKLPRYF